MRTQILKLKRGNSTKAERVFAELCKELHIPFLSKRRLKNREIDFIIGKFAVEIDGHEQLTNKNSLILELGFIPVHILNKDLLNDRTDIKKLLKKLWQENLTQN